MRTFVYSPVRGKVGDIIKSNASSRFAALFVVITVVGLILAHSVFAASPSILATGNLAQVGEGDWIFRVVDLTLDPNAPVVTHKHGAGMTYAISGPHVLTLEGKTTTLNPGQALWLGDQVTHTHATDGKTATHFLFIYLWPASQKGAPLKPGFSIANVAFESDVLTFASRQAQDVVLANKSYNAGEESGMQMYNGPTLFSVQSGKFTLNTGNNTRSIQAGEYAIVRASTPVQLKADADGQVLTESIVPAGQPALLPQAGGVIAPAEQYAVLALIGLVLIAFGVIILRRRAHAR